MATSGSPSSQSESPVHPVPPNACPNSESASAITSITIQNIGSLVPIKLTPMNFLTWSALFAPIFRRYNLTGIIDGTAPAPPKFLLDSSGNRTSTLNPQYIAWFENDQNILIWINSTLSDALIQYTIGVNSARELWSKLESRLATASQSHIHELRFRLRTITKGDSTAAAYLQQIEEIADALANAGAPIEESELISMILHGLPSEYESFIDAVQFRLGSTTIDELHGLFLRKELQLTARKKISPPAPIQAFNSSAGLLPIPTGDSGSQAFFTHNGPNLHSYGSFNRGNDSHPRNFNNRGSQRNYQGFQGNPRFHRGNQGNYRNYRGSRANSNMSTRKIYCQICRQLDHEVVECPQRMNPNFGTKTSQTAYNATTTPTWLLDSGASSHMTNSYTNLQDPESYNGPEQVYVGDGKGLPILYNYKLDPCGPVYITVGDGGNIEKVDVEFADDPGKCPSAGDNPPEFGGVCHLNFSSGPAKGNFCWSKQPEWSALRESSFGHGILEVVNSTYALWTWHRNQDMYKEDSHGDQIYIVRQSELCSSSAKPTVAPSVPSLSAALHSLVLSLFLPHIGMLSLLSSSS